MTSSWISVNGEAMKSYAPGVEINRPKTHNYEEQNKGEINNGNNASR
jgi:hypothetical protein